MNLKEKISILFIKREYYILILLFLGIIIMGLLEVVGVTTVVPFIAVVSSPELIHENIYLSKIYKFFDFQTDKDFIVFTGVCVIIVLFITNCYLAFMTWVMTYYTNMQHHRVAVRLLEHYLKQPYAFFLERNSSELEKNILVETGRATVGVVMNSLQVLSKIVSAIFLLSVLLYINYQIALVVIGALGGSYILVYILIRKKISNIGLSSVEENFKLYKTADEAISGIKDIKLHGSYKRFISQFFYPSKVLAKYGSQSNLFATLPRFLLEVVAFGGIISIVIWLVSSTDTSDTSSILPILSLYVMTGYRLMPALQQIFSGVTKIRYNLPAFESILKEFSIISNNKVTLINDNPLEFKKQFCMKDLSFSYENTFEKTLNNININIEFNSSVAIVGSTGSGKTTLIDILLGLLFSQDGKILVDGVEINNHNISSWQANIGYVPQSIYLIDDTIEENIAFANLGDATSVEQVIKAAKLANLHEFIMSLPEQYKTIVGERGVRLSGGQCQRIGIARALYNDPQVLVLDEATSSLDGVTENAIMDAIKNLSHKKTIIMIAHRLSTIQECDNIYLMSSGKIIDSGNYEDLLHNKEFQKMARMP